jgi:NTE family protein
MLKRSFLFILLFCFFAFAQSQQISSKRPKVGVVLSGGGAKGLAHIGVLKVIEELGIPVDYIGGTSMGSIIGGLYAIGYDAHQLDSITRSINWEDLLADKVSRRNLSMMEKDEDVKYMLSFPIRENKIMLPTAMVAGQNISTLFSHLCSPVYNVKDFSKFNIPYLCVAADIERGEYVVLKNGNLAEAMRASMAIPTVFTPETIDSISLLDGGLINNFPVKEVKNMGADIIIGVDVGFKYYKKDELNSLVRIIEQSIFMHTMDQNNESHDLCDVLIVPELRDYNASSFNRTDSLIAIGERAARKVYGKLSALAEEIRAASTTPAETKKKADIKPISQLKIEKLEIEGLKRIPRNFIERKLPFKIPGTISMEELELFIENLYGTWFFEKITYSLEPYNGGLKIVFKVAEKSTNYFRVGFHYDSDFKTSLLLNATFRNVFSRGSKIMFDLALGDNPSFSALFYKNSGWNPKYNLLFWTKLIPDFGFNFQARNIEVYEYTDDARTASLNFVNIVSDFFLQTNFSNNNSFSLGVKGDYSSVSGKISTTTQYDAATFFIDIYGNYKVDYYDHAFFPTKGIKACGSVSYVKGVSKNVVNTPGFFQASLRSNFIQSITRKLSVIEGIYGGTFFGDTLPNQYRFYLGGINDTHLRGSLPFIGMDFMQRAGDHVLIGKLNIQYELWKDNFITLRSNVGKATRDRKELLKAEHLLLGYGASYGYRSPIGPMEVTLMHSNKNKLSFFVNIGFWF